MVAISTLGSTYPSSKSKLGLQSIPSHPHPIPNPIQCCNFSTPKRKLGFSSFCRKSITFVVKSTSVDEDFWSKDESFRYLTKEPPLPWPFLLATAFLVHSNRRVLLEVCYGKVALRYIRNLFEYVSKHFTGGGDPFTNTIKFIHIILNNLATNYAKKKPSTLIPLLSTIIMLTSAVLAISEAASPNSVDNQFHLLTLSALIGFYAVKGKMWALLFWTLLFGLFSFSRFIQKRDYVSSVLPVAALLVGIGEPWVRVVVFGGFLGLAVVHYSKNKPQEEQVTDFRVPIPLRLMAFVIGVLVAARFVGYRHFSWWLVP